MMFFFLLAARHKVDGYIFICDPSVRTAGLAVVLCPLLREFSFVERHMFGDLFLREGKASRRDQGRTRGRGEAELYRLHVFQFYRIPFANKTPSPFQIYSHRSSFLPDYPFNLRSVSE